MNIIFLILVSLLCIPTIGLCLSRLLHSREIQLYEDSSEKKFLRYHLNQLEKDFKLGIIGKEEFEKSKLLKSNI